MGKEYSSSVTLLVLGDDLDPNQVSKELSLAPSHSWQKGQNKSYVLKDGTVKTLGSIHDWGGWKKHLDPECQPSLLEEQLGNWCDILRDKEPSISTLTNEGLYCALDIFIITKKTASIIIPAALQKRITGLGLELRISFSVGESS